MEERERGTVRKRDQQKREREKLMLEREKGLWSLSEGLGSFGISPLQFWTWFNSKCGEGYISKFIIVSGSINNNLYFLM